MTSPQQPTERPDGSYAKHTATGYDGRAVVSVLVREDDPRNPGDPHRWRPVAGNSRWLTWHEALATGTVEPLFTTAEVAAAAASWPQRPPPLTQVDAAPLGPDQYSWRVSPTAGGPRLGDLRLLAAVRDGLVQLHGTHRPAVVETATMRRHRPGLQVTRTVGAARWRALGLMRLDRRVGRLVEAGLLAEPVQPGRPGTLAASHGLPYLLTQAGLDVLERHRPAGPRRQEPAPLTVESLHRPRSAAASPDAPPAAAAITGSAAAGGPGPSGPAVRTETVDTDGQPRRGSAADAVVRDASPPPSPLAGSHPAPQRRARFSLARGQLLDLAPSRLWDAPPGTRPQPGRRPDPAASAGVPPARPGQAAPQRGGPRR